MKKNVAGQKIGAQMTTAADGTAFTGAVTVYVTGDAGTQAVGSVGSGACVHEGNGFHTYAPAQAETNYDHIAFTFTGTGALASTVQVYPTFPQTGDSFPKTTNLPADPADASDIAAALAVITGYIDTEVAATLAAVDTEVGALVTASADKTGYRLSSAGVNDILRTALTEGYAAEGATMTVEQALYMIMAILSNRSISGTTLTAKKLDGSTDAMTFTLDDATAPTSQVRAL